jgi:hypothetical protein
MDQLEHRQQLTAQHFIRSFSPLSESFPFLGCLGGHSRHPLFVASCSLLSLSVLEGSEPSLAGMARARVVHDATKAELSEFRTHLRDVCDFLTETLLTSDLEGVDKEAERCLAVYQDVTAWGDLESTLMEKALKFGDRLPGLGPDKVDAHVRLIRSLSYRFLPERAPTTWGFPRELRALPSELQSILEESDTEHYEKWTSAWATALGRNGLSKEDFTDSAQRLRRLLEWRKDIAAAWDSSWKLDTRQHGKVCERDLGWLARRLAAEGWFGEGDSRVVTRWYIREIIPFAGDVEPKSYAKYVKAAVSKIGSEVAYPESVRQLASCFRRRVETAAKGQSDKNAFRESLMLGLDFDDSTLEQSQGFFSRLADSFEQLVSGR